MDTAMGQRVPGVESVNPRGQRTVHKGGRRPLGEIEMSRTICRVMGVVFVAIALWGFITGSHVLMFHVNTAHNIVHLLSGALALYFGFMNERNARTFAMTFGVVYGLGAIMGFMGVKPIVDMLALNSADNWLHTLIAAAFLGAAFADKPISFRRPPATPLPH